MLDDEASLYISFHRILDVPGLQNCPCCMENSGWRASTPSLAEVVVKRDRKRCWDVMENMKHQGLPPNNVTCRTLVA